MENNSSYTVRRRDSMRTVDVVFVSDELVGSTIVSKKEYERILRQKIKTESEQVEGLKNHSLGNGEGDVKMSKRKANHNDINSDVKNKQAKIVDDVELALAALENDDVEKVEITQPSTLYDDGDVSAKKICNFGNTITPVKVHKLSVDTPSKLKGDKTLSIGKDKERQQTSMPNELNQTPLTLRRKVIRDIKQIQKILENSDDDDFTGSESDSSYKASDASSSETGDDDNEEEEEEEVNNDNERKENEGVGKGKKKIKKTNKNSSRSYFDSYLKSSKKSDYSSNSLKKLKNSKLTQERLDELIGKFEVSECHKNSIKTLLNDIVSLFDKWEFILQQNFNLLLYGAGSKREIVKKFAERFTDVSPVIVVNGFFPSVSGKEIIEKVCDILKIKADYNSEVVEKIESKIKNYNLDIYVVINNIDGVMLRSKKVQSMLSQLGKIEQIHVIASIDHINAPLIWDNKTSSEFNWIWFDATTFLDYTEETIYEGNLMLQNSGKATLSSLRNVYGALTKNSRGIFLIMIKNQVEGGNKKTGISFRELYEECRKELLISSDVALRTQLKEFIDHAILKQKKNADGEEQFVIAMECSILKQFLEEQEAVQ